jgi:hypothetical protein
MVNWITEYGGSRKYIESNINGGWEINRFKNKDSSDIDLGPILLTHNNSPGEISIVQSTHTGTLRIEYVEDKDDFNSSYTGESMSCNKQGYENILEFIDNYTKRFP